MDRGAALRPATAARPAAKARPAASGPLSRFLDQLEQRRQLGQLKLGIVALRRLVWLQAMALGGLILLLCAGLYISGLDVFYATRTVGRPDQLMLPLAEPNLSQRAVLSWATTTATRLMTFGFHNYRSHMQTIRSRFTSTGWDSFEIALDQAKALERIEENQLILTAVPVGPAVITEQGMLLNQYRWVIQMPLILTFQTGKRVQVRRLLVTMTLVRVPTRQSIEGIAIENWFG